MVSSFKSDVNVSFVASKPAQVNQERRFRSLERSEGFTPARTPAEVAD